MTIPGRAQEVRLSSRDWIGIAAIAATIIITVLGAGWRLAWMLSTDRADIQHIQEDIAEIKSDLRRLDDRTQ